MSKSATGSKKRLLDGEKQKTNLVPNSLVTTVSTLIKPKSTYTQGNSSTEIKCNLSTSASQKPKSSDTKWVHKNCNVIHKPASKVACENHLNNEPSDNSEKIIGHQEDKLKKVHRVVPVCITAVADVFQPASDKDKLKTSKSDSVDEVNCGPSTSEKKSVLIATGRSLSKPSGGINVDITKLINSQGNTKTDSEESLANEVQRVSAQCKSDQSAVGVISKNNQSNGEVADASKRNSDNMSEAVDVTKSERIVAPVENPKAPASELTKRSNSTSDTETINGPVTDDWSTLPGSKSSAAPMEKNTPMTLNESVNVPIERGTTSIVTESPASVIGSTSKISVTCESLDVSLGNSHKARASKLPWETITEKNCSNVLVPKFPVGVVVDRIPGSSSSEQSKLGIILRNIADVKLQRKTGVDQGAASRVRNILIDVSGAPYVELKTHVTLMHTLDEVTAWATAIFGTFTFHFEISSSPTANEHGIAGSCCYLQGKK